MIHVYVFIYLDYSDYTRISYHLADNSITSDEQLTACINQFHDDIKKVVLFDELELSSIAIDIKR